LTKTYGKLTAVNNLNLSIPSNTVFGILGPNGSGKTTTLGMILDVIEKTSGDYTWHIGKPGQERKQIGAILESPSFYPYLSALENLKIVAGIKEIDESVIPKTLEQVGLLNRKDDAFKTYSLGMKQLLAIASALLSDPEVLILDEPTNGLDPKGIVEIRDLIIQIASEGRTIILASHLLNEVQKVCTNFCVLKQGNLIFTGDVDELTRKKNHFVLSSTDNQNLIEKLNSFEFILSTKVVEDKVEVVLSENITPEYLSEKLAENRIYLTHISQVVQSLEKKFIEILAENE